MISRNLLLSSLLIVAMLAISIPNANAQAPGTTVTCDSRKAHIDCENSNLRWWFTSLLYVRTAVERNKPLCEANRSRQSHEIDVGKTSLHFEFMEVDPTWATDSDRTLIHNSERDLFILCLLDNINCCSYQQLVCTTSGRQYRPAF